MQSGSSPRNIPKNFHMCVLVMSTMVTIIKDKILKIVQISAARRCMNKVEHIDTKNARQQKN